MEERLLCPRSVLWFTDDLEESFPHPHEPSKELCTVTGLEESTEDFFNSPFNLGGG
jgi:hypothetical protein